jgi:beta-glucosidase/6-phospho-beta-glucosidase/beta-galactosidase
MTRRTFTQAMAGATLFPWAASAVAAQPESKRLPRPKFYWCVGIENTWMAQADPAKDGKRRLHDAYLLTQHYEKWREDLDRAADIGANAIRYSVPWYKVEPKPGSYDWSWIDRPIEYLVMKLGIIPIFDLVHWGTPTWMPDGVGDKRFPEAVARYAEAVARHFKGLVNHYTVHNEPQMTCLSSGIGWVWSWPPYGRSLESWVQIGVRVARGMVLTSQVLRDALRGQDPVIVSAETVFPDLLLDRYLSPQFKEKAQYQALQNDLVYFPSTLAYGQIRADSPMAALLGKHGVPAREITWFLKHAQRPDYLGYNHYPDFNFKPEDGDFTRRGKVPLRQAAREAAGLVAKGLRDAHARFQLPVFLTETSAGLTADARVAYIQALGEMTQELHRDKFPLVGLTWWPLFQSVLAEYRDNPDKPLADFLKPGGWNNGLYEIEVKQAGDLKRIPTPAVQAYRDLVRQTTERR